MRLVVQDCGGLADHEHDACGQGDCGHEDWDMASAVSIERCVSKLQIL